MTLEDLQAHFVTHAIENRFLAPVELKKDIEKAQQKLHTGEYQFTHYNTEPITDQISVILCELPRLTVAHASRAWLLACSIHSCSIRRADYMLKIFVKMSGLSKFTCVNKSGSAFLPILAAAFRSALIIEPSLLR